MYFKSSRTHLYLDLRLVLKTVQCVPLCWTRDGRACLVMLKGAFTNILNISSRCSRVVDSKFLNIIWPALFTCMHKEVQRREEEIWPQRAQVLCCRHAPPGGRWTSQRGVTFTWVGRSEGGTSVGGILACIVRLCVQNKNSKSHYPQSTA